MITRARAVSQDSVLIERELPGSPEGVWEYVTSADLLPSWLAEGNFTEQVGTPFSLSQDSPRLPFRSPGVIRGIVTGCLRPHLLECTWQHVPDGATPNPSLETLVRFELESRRDRVLLRITHSRLPSEDLPAYLSGWDTHTEFLEAAMLGSAPKSFPEHFQDRSEHYRLETRRTLIALDEVRKVYSRILDAWNRQDARGYAAEFLADARVIGFDGSEMNGREEIASSLASIFAHHRTATYVSIVREVREISPSAILLRAVAGMVPPGGKDLNPAVNAVQSLVATSDGKGWAAALFQNTPAALHGRPEEGEKLTAELLGALSRT